MKKETTTAAPAADAPASSTAPRLDDFIGRYCVVRAYYASPHAGIVTGIDGRVVSMVDARRLWRWRVKDAKGIALGDLAEHGIDHKTWTRSCTPGTVLIQDACEVIVCSPEAEKSLRECPVYQP